MDMRTEAAIVCMLVSNPLDRERPAGWQQRVNDFIRAQRDLIENLTTKSPDQALMVLEITILKYMADHEMFGIDAQDGRGLTCFPLRIFDFDRELTRGLLRSMRKKGLVYFSNGLWNDEEPRGSGYGITKKGRDKVRDFEEGKISTATFDPKKPYGGDGSVPF